MMPASPPVTAEIATPGNLPVRWPAWLTAYAVLVAVFHLWSNTLGTLPSLWQNSLHYALVGSLAGFAAAAERRGLLRIGYAITGFVALAGGAYLLFAEEPLRARGEIMIFSDWLMALVAVITALVLCRKATGWTIPILVIVAVGYVTFFGRYLDGILHFRGLSMERVLYRFYFTGEGLFGMIATISATYVFMFILFSAFLLKSGAADFIIRLARVATARVRGGAGYVAVVSSALTGTVTGSAVANTVSTGSITIPLMKRAGFRPAFAAGMETAASTGGQLMPPVMGAGAFLMAQYTGLPYTQVIAAALLPALLYFVSLGLYVFFEARKSRLDAAPEEEPERLASVLRDGLHFLAPIAVLLGLLISGFSPAYAAGGGILAIVGASWLTRSHRMRLPEIVEALALGSRNAAPTALLLVCTGLVIGTLNMTGTSVAFSQLVLSWSGGYLIAALALTAAASLVLGMGLPVTAAYVMVATVGVPALQELGVALLAAHMIIFWFSQDSNVTPPVCLAAFAAAGIAACQPMAAGLNAWRMAKALYVIPLLFAYTGLIDGSWSERLQISAFALVGLMALTAAFARRLAGPLKVWQSLLLITVAPALFWPHLAINLAGLVAVTLLAWVFNLGENRPSKFTTKGCEN
jgi:TRAP transporter 4TM/12TM fusion protein